MRHITHASSPHSAASHRIAEYLREACASGPASGRDSAWREATESDQTRCQWDAVRSNTSRRDAIVGVGGTTLFSNRERRTPLWSHAMSCLPSRTPDSNHRRLTPFAIVGFMAAAVAMHFAKLKLKGTPVLRQASQIYFIKKILDPVALNRDVFVIQHIPPWRLCAHCFSSPQ